MVVLRDALKPMKNRQIWLAGGGDGVERDISEVLLKFDVLAIGPGEPGPYLQPYLINGREARAVNRFFHEVKRGDVVVLRVGVPSIRGVGIVEGDYAYNSAFDDIDGWNVAHIRRCRWVWRGRHEWKTAGLGSQGQALVRSRRDEIHDWVGQLNIPKRELTRRLAKLPSQVGEKLSFEDLGDKLFAKGLGLEYIEDLFSNLRQIRRLTAWFKGEDISEYETIAYVVVPVLLSLGWTQQTMAVQWNNIDLALFSRLPRRSENVQIVVEVKRIGRSLRTALNQAKKYVEKKELTACKRIVVTDGRRWEVHQRHGSQWDRLAYFDVARPMEEYPVLGYKGAVTCLHALMKAA